MTAFVDKIIYLYLFICVSLLIFNILYIFGTSRTKKNSKKRVARWNREFTRVKGDMEITGAVPQYHLQLMGSRLKKIEELIAYNNALFSAESILQEEVREQYLVQCRRVFYELAKTYRKRESMERAFYAYVVSVCCRGEQSGDRLAEILLSYLDDSTIYCREQVLHAIYALGNGSAVEQAFEYFTEKQWFHHSRLIADGLMTYTGDRELLVVQLWKHKMKWLENLVVGIVQFAGNVSDGFKDLFYQDLLNEKLPAEIRLALLRYFRRYPDKRVQEYLYRILRETNGESVEYLIVAASVLDAYPCRETKEILKSALHHRNWYVRRNAALSLGNLGITRADTEEIIASGDRYAGEMLAYITERGCGS